MFVTLLFDDSIICFALEEPNDPTELVVASSDLLPDFAVMDFSRTQIQNRVVIWNITREIFEQTSVRVMLIVLDDEVGEAFGVDGIATRIKRDISVAEDMSDIMLIFYFTNYNLVKMVIEYECFGFLELDIERIEASFLDDSKSHEARLTAGFRVLVTEIFRALNFEPKGELVWFLGDTLDENELIIHGSKYIYTGVGVIIGIILSVFVFIVGKLNKSKNKKS